MVFLNNGHLFLLEKSNASQRRFIRVNRVESHYSGLVRQKLFTLSGHLQNPHEKLRRSNLVKR